MTATATDTQFSRYNELPDGFSGDRWLPWRPAGRDKIPLGRDGQPCDPADPENWLSYREARHVSRIVGDSGPRVGYALSGSRIVALDFDRVVEDRTGAVNPRVHAMIEDFQSYAELSPRGRGVHIYVAADLSVGNRRVAGLELVTKGFITVTGHPIRRGAIGEGGEPLQRIIDALPPAATTTHARPTTIPVPLPQLVRDLIARAMPNRRFRKLWAGDWSEYPSRSEADAASCMHLARNGGDLPSIVAALRQSGLARAKLRRDDYVCRQALFAIARADVRVPTWSGVHLPTDDETLDQGRQRLAMSPLARDTEFLLRLAAYLAKQRCDQDGFRRVSPQAVVGDYPGSTDRLMTRQGALKALQRIAGTGIFELRLDRGSVRINGRPSTGPVALVRTSGSDIPSIVDGFLQHMGHPYHPPVYVVETDEALVPQRRPRRKAA